eukprot:GHVN01079559.1.p1 GENE.GHVN01079559.1~~GHVN01079559.1.p1  ORF type:complete len:675 (-),score=21.21 GHVN01079559.1:108-2132(-)
MEGAACVVATATFLTLKDIKSLAAAFESSLPDEHLFGLPCHVRWLLPGLLAAKADELVDRHDSLAIDEAIEKELEGLYTRRVGSPSFADSVVSHIDREIVRYTRSLLAYIRGWSGKYGGLAKRRCIRMDDWEPAQEAQLGLLSRMYSASAETFRRVIENKGHVGLSLIERVKLNLRIARSDFNVRRSSTFTVCHKTQQGKFGKIRVYFPSDEESYWFCLPFARAFRVFKGRPFGRYASFWDDARQRPMSDHDFETFTSWVRRDLMEALKRKMVNEAMLIDEEIWLMSPFGDAAWVGRFVDYVSIALDKILYPIFERTILYFHGPIEQGSTLGLPGGWQLSSLIHVAGIRFLGLPKMVDNQDPFVVCGDDAVVQGEGYGGVLSTTIGPRLKCLDVTASRPRWLQRTFVWNADRWSRLPNFGCSIIRHKGNLDLCCSILRSTSDLLVSSMTGRLFKALSHDDLAVVYKILVNLGGIDEGATTCLPGQRQTFLLPQWVFGVYLSTDPTWLVKGIEEGLLPRRFTLSLPIGSGDVEAAYWNHAHLFDRATKDKYASSRCSHIVVGHVKARPDCWKRRLLCKYDFNSETLAQHMRKVRALLVSLWGRPVASLVKTGRTRLTMRGGRLRSEIMQEREIDMDCGCATCDLRSKTLWTVGSPDVLSDAWIKQLDDSSSEIQF